MPTTADHITHNTVSELFNHNYDDDHDPFRDIDTTFRDSSDDKATLSPRAAKRKLDAEEEKFGLGLDEEVKITKKRKPIAKLDEARYANRAQAFENIMLTASKTSFSVRHTEAPGSSTITPAFEEITSQRQRTRVLRRS